MSLAAPHIAGERFPARVVGTHLVIEGHVRITIEVAFVKGSVCIGDGGIFKLQLMRRKCREWFFWADGSQERAACVTSILKASPNRAMLTLTLVTLTLVPWTPTLSCDYS